MKSSSILHGEGRKLYQKIEKLVEKKIIEGTRIDSPGNEYYVSANLRETLSFHARGERRGLFNFARERECVFEEEERENKLLAFYP